MTPEDHQLSSIRQVVLTRVAELLEEDEPQLELALKYIKIYADLVAAGLAVTRSDTMNDTSTGLPTQQP